MKKRIWEIFLAIVTIAFVYRVLAVFNISCPIKYITGISCAGCGMTRACIKAFQLDFKTAFYYHPLFWLVPIGCVIFVCKRKIKKEIYKALVILCIISFLIVYLFRITNSSDTIVVFDPGSGIVYRLIKFFFLRR